MEISKDQIKQTLVSFGYLQNEFLDKYAELMSRNLHTIRQIGKTQSHHIFPLAAVVIDEMLEADDA